MSSLKVEVVEIDNIEDHPNADRLEIAKIAGWTCVVRKGEFKAGDKVVYIPIDAILSPDVETKLFPAESKVKLSRSRVKTIKLRGAISQGVVVSLSELDLAETLPVGTDVAGVLGITKYEPLEASQPNNTKGNVISPKKGNPAFHKYTDIENFKHYNQLFEPGEMVYVTEKLHGTSARYGWLPTVANTWWKKTKRFFGLLPRYEFCLGSRNVQLQDRKYSGFYPTDVYSKIAKDLDLKYRLIYEGQNLSIYGEIVGGGIQKNYTYGLSPSEHEFYAYDISINGKYLDPIAFRQICGCIGVKTVPLLYIGPYSQEKMKELCAGDSVIGGQKIREGIVIKPIRETTCYIGRKVLKYLNDQYLLSDPTDFH